MRCVTDQGSVVNDAECSTRAKPQGSEECNMGPCVTNWYFTSWSKTVSELGFRTRSGIRARPDPPFWPSVLGAVRPRRAEEGGGVSDSKRGQRWRRRRRLRGRQTCRDEGL